MRHLSRWVMIVVIVIGLNACSGSGEGEDHSEFVNKAPTANTGPDMSVEVDQTVSISGSGSDSDGSIVSYSWSENGTEIATTASFNYTPTTTGDHILTLTVTDNDGAIGSDTMVVRAMETIETIDLGESVDNTSLIWTNYGDADWFGQTNTAYYDGDAAQSAEIGENQSTYLKTIVTGPVNVSFYWKVSSEENYDYLNFYVDGTKETHISGTVGWIQQTVTLSSGDHVLQWAYEKDESVSAGDDCGWIDYVVISSVTNQAPTANAGPDMSVEVDQTVSISGSGSDSDGSIVSYSWSENGTEIATTASFNYTPTTTGDHVLTLTVTDDDGAIGSDTMVVRATETSDNVTIIGRITYDYVPGSAVGLDYENIVQKPVRNVIVELIDSNGNILQSTQTDIDGNYTFSNITSNTDVKVRVSAKMYQEGTPAWDIRVIDNTNSNALYVMEGSLTDVGTSDQVRDLHAPSGWGGDRYTSERVAAPFAIVDDIYATIQTVLSADSQAVFPPLQINWSVNNVALSGDIGQGQIGTSYYSNGNLFILGDEDSDTDEYDNHVITHEWGHYYEDKFSRSDSIGGSHSGGDLLDIRVAFGEGWGNAFSAISLNDPIYFDTFGDKQASGFSMNMEDQTQNNPGWFSEESLQRIIYDLWDSNNEAENNDMLSLGFGPIHRVMTGEEKEITAFTSIFSFIKLLKDQNEADSDAIDAIVANENINKIDDIFGGLNGTERSNHIEDYPYTQTNVNGVAAQVSIYTTYGYYNKLGNRVYVKFDVPSDGTYTLKVMQTNGSDSDPDFTIYCNSQYVSTLESADEGVEESEMDLKEGVCILDISEYNNVSYADFNVTVTN